MKRITFFLLVLLSTTLFAQRLDYYEASNGITYKEGDTVRLGLGSGIQGTFTHLKLGGWMTGTTSQIGSAYANTGVVIKKIKTGKMKGIEKVYFTVGGGNITNYLLDIEPAIETCEVTPCPNESNQNIVVQQDDKYDKLAKLKKLYDEGVLTEAEYESEKAKILKN